MNSTLRFCAVLAFAAVALGTAAAADLPSAPYASIELTDGRILKNVVFKSYDPAAGKVLVVANQTAMVVPANLFPAPFADRFKQDLPAAGSSTAVVATRPPAPNPTPVGTAPQPAVVMVPMPSGTDHPGRFPATVVATPGTPADQIATWKARERANNYFRHEFQAGSGAVTITRLDLELDMPQPLQGWEGQYRVTGKAYLDFFDSKGFSFSRYSQRFEALVTVRSDGAATVTQFMLR